jgi:serine protease Do
MRHGNSARTPLTIAAMLLWCAQAAAEEPRLFSFAEVVRHEKPAVVNISTTPKARAEGAPAAPPLKDFFGDFPHDFGAQSLGSGFIISKDGLILTNNHVVEAAEKIKVHLSDGREFEARVIGRDIKTDIALLRIAPREELPVVRFGDSETLSVGEWVVAIGNPFGLEQTVTVGIVSAKGRVIGSGPYDDYIQTDASINPGNSGGPLFNIRGEVIGMNTAINASGQGIGFAIPINQVRKILDQLQQTGRVVRGWLGVMVQQITRQQQKSLGMRTENGALVSEVIQDSPAERAGLQKGDVILEFDGQPITKMRALPAIVADTPVGKDVQVKLLRAGAPVSVAVRIEQLKDEP